VMRADEGERIRREALLQLSKELTDQGKLIEAGWISLRLMTLPLDASDVQLNDMRMAFFAGAQHLFASLMAIMDPGAEPTEQDCQRMEKINNELQIFLAEMQLRTIQVMS
jgi:hypothetical protein